MAYMASASTVVTLIGFCVSVIFIVFVCTRFACALARRRRRRQLRSAGLPQYAASSYVFSSHVERHPAGGATGNGGLDPAAVGAFPTRAFAGGTRVSGASSSDDAQCVVCLAEYEDKDMLRSLPYCGHNFHMACIDLWLEQNSTCPVCRISLRDNHDKTLITPPPTSVVISLPCSPQALGSDPCRCLFLGTGHSLRPSDVPRHEPNQENQVASNQSVDAAANNVPLSEVNSPPENNNHKGRKQLDGSTQLEPCK